MAGLPEPMDHPWVISDRAPLYVLRLPEDPAPAQIESFFVEAQRWLPAVAVPWVLVVDLTELDGKKSTAARRRLFAGLSERVARYLHAPCRGVAVVASSRIKRGVATAVLWSIRPRYAVRLFGDAEDAERWLGTCLRDSTSHVTA